MIARGEAWEEPVPEGTVPDAVVIGGDGDLARRVSEYRGRCPLVRWTPSADSDLARAVGLVAGAPERGLALACDLLWASGAPAPAVNTIELGTFPPGRLTKATPTTVEIDGATVFDGPASAVVVASGQFRAGIDLVPRGHPGDGRAEVIVVALTGRDRAAFARRMAAGEHLPHPDVPVGVGRDVAITMEKPRKLVGDGGAWRVPDVRAVEIRVVSPGFRLLV